VYSLVSHASAPIFVCVVEKRLVSSKPEAFLQVLSCTRTITHTHHRAHALAQPQGLMRGGECRYQDLRQRFEREVGEDSSSKADDAMERLLGKMMRVYSPGYEADPEDPQLIANATEWLRRFA
jgi:hypothetical protein